MNPTETALVLAAVLVAAFVKGAVGFGFPVLATSLLAVFLDVRVIIPLLIVPNIAMDGWQAVRGPGLRTALVRHRWLLVSGTAGMFAGTAILAYLPAARLEAILGTVVLAFVTFNVLNLTWRVPPEREWWLSPSIGAFGGVVGGVTNAPGIPLILYFYALGLEKREFVQSIALAFLAYKVAQLASVSYFGLLSFQTLGLSSLVAVVALVSFRFGRRVQARLDARVFNRIVLMLLAAIGGWLIIRSF